MELLESIIKKMQEAANIGSWLESRIHLNFTMLADDMFGDGRLTRDERIAMSGAIGAALDAFRESLDGSIPGIYERGRWEDAPEVMAESADFNTEYVPLIERAVDADGTIPIKIIQPGWGSSGYYPAEVLERDGPKVFTAGTKMYWNHQTQREAAERPEGDLNNLAAVLTEDAQWDADGLRGPGLYAKSSVNEQYRGPLDEMADHIGVSINAQGAAKKGTAEGRDGLIVQSITERKSVDFVTEPGAGGEIISMFESARQSGKLPKKKRKSSASAGDDKNLKESANMDLEKRVADLEASLREHAESKTALTEGNTRLAETVEALQDALKAEKSRGDKYAEQMLIAEAGKQAQVALAEAKLPNLTRQRLARELVANIPTTEEGALDGEKFAEAIKGAVDEAVQEISQAMGSTGRIIGMGESNNERPTDEVLKEAGDVLEQAFADLGMSESAAKVAAGGR